MKTLKKIAVGVLCIGGMLLALHEDYRPIQDFWAMVAIGSGIGLFLYWNRWNQLEDEDELL